MCILCENNRLRPPPMSVRLKVVCPSAFGGIVRQGHAAVAIYASRPLLACVTVAQFAIEDSCVLIFSATERESNNIVTHRLPSTTDMGNDENYYDCYNFIPGPEVNVAAHDYCSKHLNRDRKN
uniref:Uncharacterized protein n=1 Tax=Schizaphis graminum TaxID=13262 RepID=A0A2S2P178_SCHGA